MHKKGMALVEIVVSMLILAVSALAVTATVSVVNSKEMRSAGGGSSLDLQALSYARETLETLKNAVSTAPRSASLSIGIHDSTTDSTNPLTAVPVSDLKNHGGARMYTVSSVGGGTDLKKVTVVVTWDD